VFLSDSLKLKTFDGQITSKEHANRETGSTRVPIRASQSVALFLVGQVPLSLRKQEPFMAVALCFASPR
jgi:hypothetical protein